MSSLIYGPVHPATTHGHMGGPRLYDTLANVFFLGRRRATFQALIAAASVQPGQRVLDVGCGTWVPVNAAFPWFGDHEDLGNALN